MTFKALLQVLRGRSYWSVPQTKQSA